MNILAAPDLSVLQKSIAIETEVFALLDQIETWQWAADSLGFKNPKWSPAGLVALAQMPSEKVRMLTKHLELWNSWITLSQSAKGQVDDFVLLQLALSHYGLEISDELRETLDGETVVEVYSEDMIQIFRSFRMLSMTSYSLLDLCAHEWFVLWERPQLTMMQMQEDVKMVLQTETPCRKAGVTPHVVKETFNTGMTEPFVPRSSFVKFQHIGYLKRLTPDAPRAFICTAKGNLISANSLELEQISFL